MNDEGDRFTCHMAVPSAVCSSRRSSAADGPPLTLAPSESPPLLSCTHTLYTNSILRERKQKTDRGEHQIRDRNGAEQT